MIEILGNPVARLRLAADRPQAVIAVRLCDVWPDGASTLITRGLKNLSHRDSDAHPEPLVPGERYAVEVPLLAIGYRVAAGHRLRLAVSAGYWPWAWPAPDGFVLSLSAGPESALELPVWTGSEHVPPGHFGLPERAPMPRHELRPGRSARELRRDVGTGATTITSTSLSGHRLTEDGLAIGEEETDVFSVTDGAPLSAQSQCDRVFSVGRGEWQVTIRTHSTLSATATAFHLTNALDAYDGAQRVFARTWNAELPRDNT